MKVNYVNKVPEAKKTTLTTPKSDAAKAVHDFYMYPHQRGVMELSCVSEKEVKAVYATTQNYIKANGLPMRRTRRQMSVFIEWDDQMVNALDDEQKKHVKKVRAVFWP